MNVLDLLTRLNGEILSNKARAVVDGKIVILARMHGTDWVYTEEGQALANMQSNVAADEATAKPKRAKKAETTQEPPTAVELADIQPDVE